MEPIPNPKPLWIANLKIVDEIRIKPLWNRTAGMDTIAVPTKVLGFDRLANSQTGVMVNVLTESGRSAWLDADWFEPSDRYVTVVYLIESMTDWAKSSPMHFRHNGLKAVAVLAGDLQARGDHLRNALERIKDGENPADAVAAKAIETDNTQT